MMQSSVFFSIVLLVSVLITQCHPKPNKTIDSAPDPQLADVFKSLDGRWQGKFYILSNRLGTIDRMPTKGQLTYEWLDDQGLIITDSIDVTQVYRSLSPYYQEVDITDRYSDRTITSAGFNQVIGNRLECVVNKPDETIVHEGQLIGDNTIIWSRSISEPNCTEYFVEHVDSTMYTIAGYGYYSFDDTTKVAPTWYLGRYFRQPF